MFLIVHAFKLLLDVFEKSLFLEDLSDSEDRTGRKVCCSFFLLVEDVSLPITVGLVVSVLDFFLEGSILILLLDRFFCEIVQGSMVGCHILNDHLFVLITLKFLILHQELGILKNFARIFIELINFVQIYLCEHFEAFLALVDLNFNYGQI